jgi:flagellin
MSNLAQGKTVDYSIYKFDAATGNSDTGTFSVTFDTTNPISAGTLVDYVAMHGAGASSYISTGLSVGTIANSSTKLYDIDLFWNSEGRFLLKDPQTITITQGSGKQTSITLYQNDTIGSLVQKLNDAIGSRETGLGQEKYATNNSFVEYVPANSAAGGASTTAGTIVIRSAVTGDAGKLSFAGDEDVIKALSMNVLKAATASDYNVTISDAHTNETVASGQVTGNKLISMVHENVDVIFDSMLGIRAGSVGADGYFAYQYDSAAGRNIYLHLADNTTVFQIGANEGEDMGINIGDMRAEALGLNAVLVTDRESAARSVTIIDNAIDKVSTQRARLGAYQNRLEHTIANLTVASENLTAAESRIRDTDMAKEMMNFTKLQIMLQAGTSMLAQANALPQNVLGLLR